MAYTFGTVVECGFDEAVERVIEKLKGEGFGVLTDIDVAATLKKKIDQELPPYRILGACNPPLAAKAIDADVHVGALLPCNVVVRAEESGGVAVEFLDPNSFLGLSEFEAIQPIASEARVRLQRVMEALS
ncbi:MAG: DUF302 domain-containing protein [Gammaproteobacteria bacterium]|jgi:uncharacterized protein (DUF302 family)|nr:DUF302 domain-containing protein [Gammaproteobacteria bacterium]